MALRLHNTLTRRIEPFRATDPARVTFYSCGPTVYDDAHIGNFRSFLIADLLRRWLESPLCVIQDADGNEHDPGRDGPRTVRHVMNITDVGHMTEDDQADGGGEDKMQLAGQRLLEAKKAGTLPEGTNVDPRDPYAIAGFYRDRFLEDARRLGLKVATEAEANPELMPVATDYVANPGRPMDMVRVIQRLIDNDRAYVVGEPGGRAVYFHVPAFEGYGRLSGNTLEALRSGAGGRIDEGNQAAKKHAADFLLWKEDAGHIMQWDSPWGRGYPGWHVECSAMAFATLATASGSSTIPDAEPIIDLHSGGEDNIFPHHECEIAQSCCAFNADPSGASFARHWFHPRFLLVEGQKMSKSKGNFYTARDLFSRGIEPAALRLALIRTHYRSNADFTEQLLKDSQRMIERWRRFADARANGPEHPAATGARLAFAEAMHDDLNIASAIAAVNTMLGAIDEPTSHDASALQELDASLGVLALEKPQSESTSIGLFAPGVEPDPAVLQKLEDRKFARARKDYAASDAIRDELAAMGYAIKDVAGGKVEVSRA
ncbi:MAG: cysteine--tRNA ligase [Planctomycetota bacterium]